MLALSPRCRHASRAARRRGASLVEYIVVVCGVALLCIAGFRAFGGKIQGSAEAAGRCVEDLTGCDAGNPDMSRTDALVSSRQPTDDKLVTLRKSTAPVSATLAQPNDDDGGGETSSVLASWWNGTRPRRSGPSADADMEDATGALTALPDGGAGGSGNDGKDDFKPRLADPSNKPGGTGPCDRELSRVFGGADTIAAGSGYEPTGFSGSAAKLGGLDRSQAVGPMPNNWGHLFGYAMHIYAVPTGVGQATLYIPPGFTKWTPPSGKDGVTLFYYPKLMGEKNVTLAVYHVDDFRIERNKRNAAGSVRIGLLGGPGGDGENYIHSHLEVHRGWGLPKLAQRDKTRLFFPDVFCK